MYSNAGSYKGSHELDGSYLQQAILSLGGLL